ncbi:MAG: TonB-dependent receptor [Gammaproteobacteria bacterium]|nr:TonB-dependent receptor [Gammaproteobacteria bacterium]
MNNIHTLVFTAALTAFSPILFADDDANDNIIVVTAEYRETNLIDTATSVSVLSEDVIKDAGEQHLEDVLSLVANFNWAGGSSRPRYFQIRGIGARKQYNGAPNPSVGTVIDDIDFSGIGMIATLFDTQQVEVLRGPQSGRFGANALAGLIYIKTRDPEQESNIRTQMMFAEDDNWSTAVSVTGSLNEQQTVTGLFSFQQFEGNGFRYNSFLDRDDTNNRDEMTSRAKIHWQITDDWHLAFTGMLVDMDNGYDAWAIDNSLTTLSDKPGKDSQRSLAGSARLTHQSDKFEFISISTLADSDIEHSYDGDWGNDISWGVNGPYDFTSDNLRTRKTWSQEFRFVSTPAGAFNQGKTDWLFGLYTLELEEDNEIVELYNGWTWREHNSNYEATNAAIFAEVNQHLTDNTDLIVALRYERRDVIFSNSDNNYFTPNDQMFGGHITLRHYLPSGLMAWASISRGYKAGGFNTGSTVPNDRVAYDPEFLWNYEAGIKGRFLDQKLLLSSSVFYMAREDEQISTSIQLDPTDPLTFIEIVDNAAEGYNRGIETELQYQLTDDLKIDASLGILDTAIETYEGGDPKMIGREKAHAPAYNYSIALEYRNQQGWFGRLDISKKDEFYYSDSHHQQSEAYQLLNMKVGYESENWEIYLWGRNLTDEIYHVRGFFFANEPPNWEDKLYTHQGDPRQFGITGRMTF